MHRIVEYKGIKIHLLKVNSNYRRCICNVSFIDDYSPEKYEQKMLLMNVLTENNKKFPRRNELQKEKLRLYNTKIDCSLDALIGFQLTKLFTTFPNPKYTSKEMLKESLDFFFNFIHSPNIDNNSFSESTFIYAKNGLLNSAKSTEENTRSIALRKVNRLISPKIPLSVTIEEQIGFINAITKEKLVKYYKELFKNNIEIFFIGNVDFDEVLDIIKDNIDKMPKLCVEKTYKPSYNSFKINKNIINITEKKDVAQSILVVSCNFLKTTNREKRYVHHILRSIMHKKLFGELREKKSLFYAVRSEYAYRESHIEYIFEINKNNKNKVILGFNKILNDIKNNKISEKQIMEIKKEIVDELNSSDDSINSILKSYISSVFYNSKSAKEKKEIFLSVTKDEIVSLAKKIMINIIYLLEEEDSCDKEKNN